MNSIIELDGKHKGQDIYVLGSGASLNFVSPSFFDGKTTVGVNWVYKKYPCTYLIAKHGDSINDAMKQGCCVISSRFDMGIPGKLNPDGSYCYELMDSDICHEPKKHIKLKIATKEHRPKLSVGHSTIITAIDFAYFLGAKNIILCGVDCGLIDNLVNYTDYQVIDFSEFSRFSQPQIVMDKCRAIDRLKICDLQLSKFANYLRRLGVNVHSLNPFVTLALEGHTFVQPEDRETE